VLVTAATIGEAFDDIWTLERACQILVTAWSTGQPLKVLSAEVAEKTPRTGRISPIFPASTSPK
jgi:ribulose-5-phosphate 4-epimerase/fuculose-1-phosphate aldolase